MTGYIYVFLEFVFSQKMRIIHKCMQDKRNNGVWIRVCAGSGGCVPLNLVCCSGGLTYFHTGVGKS